MRIRFVSAGLWFLAAAYAGSILNGVTGLHEAVGSVMGLATAALIVVNPVRVLIRRSAAPEVVSRSDTLPEAA
jgi:hypothetical protein